MPKNKVSDPITDQEIAFIDPQPSPAPDHQEDQQEDSPSVPACPGEARSLPWKPKLAPAGWSDASRPWPQRAHLRQPL